VKSAKGKSFSRFSLDAINFLLGDVRGAPGPYLAAAAFAMFKV
jgi:hypothetical protein